MHRLTCVIFRLISTSRQAQLPTTSSKLLSHVNSVPRLQLQAMLTEASLGSPHAWCQPMRPSLRFALSHRLLNGLSSKYDFNLICTFIFEF